MSAIDLDRRGVGPVLQATPFAEAIVAAIQDENDDVEVRHEGAYMRVLVPDVCRLSRAAVVAMTGQDVQFPGDLEVDHVLLHRCDAAYGSRCSLVACRRDAT